jgi:hypothetical protein
MIDFLKRLLAKVIFAPAGITKWEIVGYYFYGSSKIYAGHL